MISESAAGTSIERSIIHLLQKRPHFKVSRRSYTANCARRLVERGCSQTSDCVTTARRVAISPIRDGKAPSVHHSGERIIRVDQKAGRQAAAFHKRGGRRRVEVSGAMGQVEEGRDQR